MIYKNCANCGKEFGIKKPSEANRPNRICCSRSCSVTYKNLKRYSGIGLTKKCEGCGNEFFCKYARERKIKKFCSVNCCLTYRNKNILPSYMRLSGVNAGENSINWKGEDAGYFSKHSWIRRKYGRADECQVCEGKKTRVKRYEWANISGKYERNRSDWIQLCVRCHRKMDLAKLSLDQLKSWVIK